jgi:hypothetical protein
MRLFAVFGLLLLFGCDDSKSSSSADLSAAVGDMALVSSCGHPGDKGNSKGVGQFCVNLVGDCPSDLVCSHALMSDTYFCTKTCTPPVDIASCGPDTICQCNALGCGCTPTSCPNERG